MKLLKITVLAVAMLAFSQQSCSVDNQALSVLACEETVKGREVQGGPSTSDPAPDECLQTLRSFLAYCFDAKKDILDDGASQGRWLTPALRDQILDNERRVQQRRKEFPTDRIDSVSNNDFIGFWDLPSSFSILGSRRYGHQATIDVEYSWVTGTNYDGDIERVAYSLKCDGKTWRVDDVFLLRGPYIPTGLCLSQRLRERP
jgi:hypothetical protein